MKQDVIYVTGHQHPDTDSIAAAIGYAFFKRANGVKAIPCRLGKIGTETRYLLDRFGFEEPMLLEDARVKMSEIEIDEPTTIMPDKTIFEAIQLMHGAGKQTCGVVDAEDRVVGMLTMNDIGLVAMGDTAETEKLLEDVSPENINTAISGKIIYRAPDRHIRGRVSVVAITKEDIAIHDIKDKIVVAGDDPAAQKNIIEMGAGLLILVRTDSISDEVLETAKKYGCTVILSGHSFRFSVVHAPIKSCRNLCSFGPSGCLPVHLPYLFHRYGCNLFIRYRCRIRLLIFSGHNPG